METIKYYKYKSNSNYGKGYFKKITVKGLLITEISLSLYDVLKRYDIGKYQYSASNYTIDEHLEECKMEEFEAALKNISEKFTSELLNAK